MKNLFRPLLVKGTKLPELSLKLDSGSCFVLIGLVLKRLKGIEEVGKHRNRWIGVYPHGLAWRTNSEARKETISWLLTHKICMQTTLKCHTQLRLLHMSYTLIFYWWKQVIWPSSRSRIGKYSPPDMRSKQVTCWLRPTSIGGDIFSY